MRLTLVAAFDLRLARLFIDELDHACAAFFGAKAERHRLDHEAEPRICWRALGLTQQPRSCALPGAGHGPQNAAQLNTRLLRKALVCLFLEGLQRFCERVRHGFGLFKFEQFGIETLYMQGVGLYKSQIERVSGLFAETFDHLRMARIIHTDIEDRTGPAPIGVF